jgi:putative ABC transport system ATP-binding protein
VSCADGPKPLLQVENLRKTFSDGQVHREILSGLDFSLAQGEMLVLWGPSGSGKSTLLNILAGVLAADTGEIKLLDHLGTSWSYGQDDARVTTRLRRQLIGYVFQFFNLIPTLTIAENIELTIKLASTDAAGLHSAQELRRQALAKADALGLTPLLNVFPETLSGGEQQRAALVRALAHQPRLLLADEPTGNLDASNAARVMAALVEQLASSNCGLVVATHDPIIAEQAHRVIALPC